MSISSRWTPPCAGYRPVPDKEPMCISKACFPTCWISYWCAWRMSWRQGRKARVGEAGEQKWPVPGAWMRGWVQRVVGQLTEPQRRVCVLVLLALQPALSIIHRLHVALFYICGAFSHLGNKTAGISYLASGV